MDIKVIYASSMRGGFSKVFEGIACSPVMARRRKTIVWKPRTEKLFNHREYDSIFVTLVVIVSNVS